MVILISFCFGITSINAVIAVAGANVAMILFGWLQEQLNPPGRTSTTALPFWFGCLVGIAPWVAIAVNLVGSTTTPGADAKPNESTIGAPPGRWPPPRVLRRHARVANGSRWLA